MHISAQPQNSTQRDVFRSLQTAWNNIQLKEVNTVKCWKLATELEWKWLMNRLISRVTTASFSESYFCLGASWIFCPHCETPHRSVKNTAADQLAVQHPAGQMNNNGLTIQIMWNNVVTGRGENIVIKYYQNHSLTWQNLIYLIPEKLYLRIISYAWLKTLQGATLLHWVMSLH